MKKFYNSPAFLIKEYELSEAITTSAVMGGEIDDSDDSTIDMTGEI